jgi:hypothetical protein
MLGPRSGSGGSGALGVILLCACGWFGLCYLGNLRHRALAPVPTSPPRSVPSGFPFTRQQPEPDEPRDAAVPTPEPTPDDPDDDDDSA